MSVWLITGASRGLGLEIARAALERGDQVAATARDPHSIPLPDGENLTKVALDVTDPAQVERAVAAVGRVDVLVNNAGYGIFGAVEEVSDAEVRAVFDTNVFGLLAVTRAVLPGMRERRSGRVINIGSIGGFITQAGSGIYAATKFALEGITEAMRGDLEPLGVAVTIVEPGAFRTDFLDPSSLRHAELVIDDYAGTAGERRRMSKEANGFQAGDPAKAAAAIVDLAHTPHPPTRLQLGQDAVARVRAKLDHVARELDVWEHVSTATDHD
ncbi:oxidoreductase [Saccharopolyspora taberi]|uniref:SDR family NAD(P)-dependent oxidoreductase n=1 Tax=Saccharopolyspora taberi TaxID=60895 RepID=A0ABN3VKK8_9PSEU